MQTLNMGELGANRVLNSTEVEAVIKAAGYGVAETGSNVLVFNT